MKAYAFAVILLASSSPLVAQGSTSKPIEDGPSEVIFQDEMVEAQEEVAEAVAAEFEMLGDLFKPEPLTAEQEARLPTAERMTDVAFPVGSFRTIMETSIAPMMDVMMGLATLDDATALSEITGMAPEDLAERDETELEEALQVLDPHYDERSEAVGKMTVTLMAQMFDALEPSYRSGLSRAFASRFTQAEMDGLMVFFGTPLGAKYAREAILVQYDPQMMTMMEEMGPAMAEVLPAFMTSMVGLSAQYPDARKFGDLSEAERARVAGLLGRSQQELEALQPVEETLHEDDDIAI